MRFFWSSLAVVLPLLGCSNGDGNESGELEERKVAACQQIFVAGCDTLVRCGAVPADSDCLGTLQKEPDWQACTDDFVDEFTQDDVDTCSADMRAFPCKDLCGVVP